MAGAACRFIAGKISVVFLEWGEDDENE